MTLLLFYTDPGSGMMLLQILFAIAASALFYFRKFFYKFFGNDKPIEKLPKSESVSETAHIPKNEV